MEKVLNWRNVGKGINLNENHALVNINMIYWRYSEALQKKENDTADILLRTINRIDDERSTNILMSAEDIKKCFYRNTKNETLVNRAITTD